MPRENVPKTSLLFLLIGFVHRDAQKTEDQAKKRKVDEKAYEDALKSIPPSSEKSDPWKSMR